MRGMPTTWLRLTRQESTLASFHDPTCAELPSRPSQRSVRSISRVLLVAVVSIGGCAVGTTYVKPGTDFSQVLTVAVMPFASNKAGLGIEVANRMTMALLHLNRFEIVESTALMQKIFRSTGETLLTEDWTGNSSEPLPSPITSRQFAEALGVDAVLAGSIRRYGNWFVGKDMNIDAKLIGADGSILWACNYKTDWAFTGLGTEGSLASKIVKETMKRFKISLGLTLPPSKPFSTY